MSEWIEPGETLMPWWSFALTFVGCIALAWIASVLAVPIRPPKDNDVAKDETQKERGFEVVVRTHREGEQTP